VSFWCKVSSTPQPKIKSPLPFVVADPLEGLVPEPFVPAVPSAAAVKAIPLYSWTATTTRLTALLKLTVTVFSAPP
jgi:hypothetical protein